MFRRRRGEGGDRPDDEPAAEGQDSAGSPPAESPPAAVTGPYDGEAPEDGLQRVDLGALLVPVVAGAELRLELTAPPDPVIHAVTIVTARSALQLSAFAAPRTEGIWAEVREEICASLREQGGAAEEVEGEFGTEVSASVPTPVPGQLAPARFFAVDGPRWFLRGVLTGAALAPGGEPEAALLRTAFRLVVVVRGGEAMAVRDQLPLRLPPDTAILNEPGPDQAPGGPLGQEPGGPPGLGPPERGPEITETR